LRLIAIRLHDRCGSGGYITETEGALELMKRVKRAFDPGNIMNPGKVVSV
jgi:FAD/FMN-containing dehydrogenase